MSVVNLTDRLTVRSTRRMTDNGFLSCRGLVARTGIQEYMGYEIGLDPMKVYKIYRPESVVFDQKVLDSLNGIDITNDHPKGDVNSKSYKALTCGVVTSKGVRSEVDPQYIECDLLVKDAQAIASIEGGKTELSAGYSSEVRLEDGVTPEGLHYDGRIDSIRFNHVAIVNKGRAQNAHILDHGVNMKAIDIGGVTVTIADENAEAVILAVNGLNAKFADEKKAKEEAEKALKDAIAEKTALADKVSELEGQVKTLQDTQATPEAVKAIVGIVNKTLADARVIAGEDFKSDSVVDTEIMKEAIKVKDSALDLSKKSEDYIRAYFDAKVAAMKDAQSSHQKLADAITNKEQQVKEEKDPYQTMKDKACAAWKRPQEK